MRLFVRLLAGLIGVQFATPQVITTITGTTFTFPSSSLAATNAPLGQTGGAAVDASGNVYVADAGNNLVLRFVPGGQITVVAGNGIAGFSGDGGPATSASINVAITPGLAVDTVGNLYIADANNNRIRKVSGGTITTVAGNGAAGFSGDGGVAIGASLAFPSGVAVDSAGNLYIADQGNNRIRKVSGGTITTVAGNGNFGFSGDGAPATSASLFAPCGAAVDSSGNLYIADSGNNRVRKVSAGIITTVAGDGIESFSGDGGPATSASLDVPCGVAVDSAGNLYIADTMNNRIREVSSRATIVTVAGNGTSAFSGDGGVATSASLDLYFVNPDLGEFFFNDFTGGGLAVDSSGNLYIADSYNERIREVSSGAISTIAGNGNFDFAGEGSPATAASLQDPAGVAVDSAGNLYIADYGNNRIRKVSGGTITTVAGNGAAGFSGDGGPATGAELRNPAGVAVDSAGNLYIADNNNNRIREVSGGTITTFAGNGLSGFPVEGGPATSASLKFPSGVAMDSAGNLYIADSGHYLIAEVLGGIFTIVAGNENYGFSGDGGPATSASLSNPQGVAVDSAGNLYIADYGNNRIRKVSGGTIATVAGDGIAGFSGDGGPATSASLKFPSGVAVDSAGNLYIADSGNNRVRKVSAGIITTVAGDGIAGFSGDGGPATSAALNSPSGVAVDSAGNLYIADAGDNRIREVLASATSYQVTPANLSFSATTGGSAPAAQTISLSSSVAGLAFSVSTSATWLSVSPSSGAFPSILQVSVDPTSLVPNTYQGTVTITAPNANRSTQMVAVSLTVTAGSPSQLAVSTQSLPFSLAQQASPGTASFTISNTGSGSTRYTAAATTSSGGNWLQLGGSASGSVTDVAPVNLTVTATPGTLASGTYNGTITVTGPDTGQNLTVTVILAITAAPPAILLSQLGFTFTAVAQGGTVLPQTLGILNSGAGTLNYSVQATTQSGGSGWLSVSATSGTVAQALVDVSNIDVSINTNALPSPGTYYGQILVTAAGASNSPQAALVILNVLAPGSNPGPDVRPTGLVFTGAVGAENSSSQNVTVANVTANPITFVLNPVPTYLNGSDWLNYQPTDYTVPPNTPEPIVVQPNFSSLGAGIYRAVMTIAFDDGSIRNVSVLSVVAPAGTVLSDIAAAKERVSSEPRQASGCTPTVLQPLFTATGLSLNLTVGYPAFIAAIVVDDCGMPVTSGSVTVSFNNGDPPLSLISTQNGSWTTSWQPTHTASNVQLTLAAMLPSLNLTGTAQESIGAVQQGAQTPPLLTGSPLGAGTLATGPFAPGDLMLIKGIGLADGQASSTSSTLKNQLAGASVVIGTQVIPLLYADATQVLGLVPLDAPVNTSPGVIVLRDSAQGVQVPVIISTTHPAILTADGSGQGQGAIYKANGSTTTLADASNPVNPGDRVIIYCTGLGATDSNGNASNIPAVTIGGATAQISYAGVALPASYPASGAPTLLGLVSASLGGLYEINATVPTGVAGQVAVSVSSAGQTSQTGVTMMISGSAAATPVIASIDTAGGFPTIAQNGWIEIKGSNLAPASVGSGVTWSSAPSFASGQLPTQLNDVSATVDGEAAFIYFVSPTQINVLTPLDSTTGPVQVIVNNNGATSAPFPITENAVAPSFLLFGATNYIVATHANYSLAGPASLSSPGYPFMPAAPGETITFYAVGFGLPSTTLVNGSATQSGPLPTLPLITIGGTQATVSFAGVISPGLYQFNVVIPSNAANGDNLVTCAYGGFSTPSGDLITVQR